MESTAQPERSRHERTLLALVVGDGVEEVVVARVEHGVHHASSDTKHGTTAVLDLNVEGAVTSLGVLDLSRVASRDERRRAVVAAGEILGAASVLAGRHGHGLGNAAEEENLGQSEAGDVGEGGEAHAVVQDGAEGNVSGKVEGAGEGDAEFLDHHANEGSHGDATVLDLDGAAAGEALGVFHKAKGIEEVERTRIDTQTVGGASFARRENIERQAQRGKSRKRGATAYAVRVLRATMPR